MSQNPQVKFTTNGAYSVTLNVYKGVLAGIKVRPEYIHAGTPGLWTGITSTDWSVASNWHNFLLPGSSVNVLIPSSAPNWPHVSGDLTIGGSCNSITLTGSAELYVGGVFTINPGKILDIKLNAAVYANGH